MARPTVYAYSYNTDDQTYRVLRRLTALARDKRPYASAYRLRLQGVPTIIVVILSPPNVELRDGVQRALRGGWPTNLHDDVREHFIARSRAARDLKATAWIQYELPLPLEPGEPWPIGPDGRPTDYGG